MMRKKNFATQREIADFLGTHECFLSQWKKGKKEISKNTAIEWGKKLRVDPAKLIFSDAKKRPGLLGLKK
jgi:transcriptional regulator with XRE-family HTH domain